MSADPLDLAAALHVLGREADAEALYRQALAARPDDRRARNNLLALLRMGGRRDEAEALLRDGVARRPDDRDLRLRLATTLLAAGRYAEGWPLYEARRGAAGPDGVSLPMLSLPEWRGEAVGSLLVWPEGGYGEMIQFARFLAPLAARGIAATLLCPPRLAGLFQAAGLSALAMEDGVQAPDCQAWTPLGSLPLRLGVTLEALPPPLAIRAEPVRPPGGVGVVGKGFEAWRDDPGRALPDPFVQALMTLPAAVSLDPADTGAFDLGDAAAIVAGLDHVITVDAAVAHLAGSMGKPVSLLLPFVGANWRWLNERTDSPWYPSLRIYRQSAAARWPAVLDQMLADLGEAVFRPAAGGQAPAIEIAVAKPSPPPLPKATPASAPAAPPSVKERSVWIVSYNNHGNFGDRLGPQLLNGLLPPNARVTHLHHKPWDAPPEGAPDLLIVGAGGSLFTQLLTPELLALVERAPQAIGLFGTQYRENLDRAALDRLLGGLSAWWARYEEDALLYGQGRTNVRHMGDFLVDAFPMSRWTIDAELEVGAEVAGNAPLDRMIERIQAYRRVRSGRMHPLLCALTSADQAAYAEQYEDAGGVASGKFRSMLVDIFGAEQPAGALWDVDRAAVGAYKAKVRANLAELRADLARRLAS
ncbi:tetratricopeptide repeat protein [Phenylobacterium sp.]|jgi:hypothetical protein|uniref:tetratricopeptide repeat protein n=1 Tax=Phenylobacterium sp. TaxID=1871053 RepID=UPI002F418011